MIFPKINGSLKKFWGKKMTKNIRVSLSNICLFLGRPKMFFLSVLIVFFLAVENYSGRCGGDVLELVLIRINTN